jgi:hypothetical protein
VVLPPELRPLRPQVEVRGLIWAIFCCTASAAVAPAHMECCSGPQEAQSWSQSI